MRFRLLAAAVLGVLAIGTAATGAQAQDSADAQRLAERYAPIVMVRKQVNPPCDTSREQYELTTVDTVLGNPSVTLRRTASNGRLEPVKQAPTAADLATLGEGYYLDLRGHPRGDTCVYARDFAKLVAAGHAPVVTYAHVAREDGREGLALQFWFFWYFNQFNDLHEGDWEGMQIVWDEADTPAEALQQEPSQMVLFQHAGGERADWNAAKVEKDGDHPGGLRGGRLARDVLQLVGVRRERRPRLGPGLRQHVHAAALSCARTRPCFQIHRRSPGR